MKKSRFTDEQIVGFLSAHTTKSDATRDPGFPGKAPQAMRPKVMLPAQLKLELSARFK